VQRLLKGFSAFSILKMTYSDTDVVHFSVMMLQVDVSKISPREFLYAPSVVRIGNAASLNPKN